MEAHVLAVLVSSGGGITVLGIVLAISYSVSFVDCQAIEGRSDWAEVVRVSVLQRLHNARELPTVEADLVREAVLRAAVTASCPPVVVVGAGESHGVPLILFVQSIQHHAEGLVVPLHRVVQVGHYEVVPLLLKHVIQKVIPEASKHVRPWALVRHVARVSDKVERAVDVQDLSKMVLFHLGAHHGEATLARVEVAAEFQGGLDAFGILRV
mmetsp:Transcript_103281/g.143906  ORF Transcript_103281/g.143906 Transcript_103281/m.143906 type:complete len:211 (-) Transcript_103281:274-906(-)